MASWAGKGYKLQGSVETCLSSLQQECSSTEYTGALRTILRTLKNVQEHPGEGSYKQIKKTNKTFSQKVWMFSGGQQLMYSIGWTDLDDTIVLLDSRQVLATISLIEARLRCSPPGRASVAKSAQSAKGRQAYQSGWSNMACGEEDCDSWSSTYQTQKTKTTVAKKPRKPRATRSSYGGSYGSSGYGGGASCSTLVCGVDYVGKFDIELAITKPNGDMTQT
ncbi:hypothetical protein LSAT2_029662 [Lamellibrachia satsuma]|nr:hypothetical protein LSAT2_029662 [Lamellibrachia satsuma]